MRIALLLLVTVVYAAAADLPPAETKSVRNGLLEFGRICEPIGMLLWHKSLCGPLILVDPGTGEAIADRLDAGTRARLDRSRRRCARPEKT